MNSEGLFACGLRSGIAGAIGLLMTTGRGAIAQSVIVPDSTLGTENSQVIQNFNGQPTEVIVNGARRGQNLFHSFQEFNVTQGRSAYFFSPDASIQNILARITGNNPSNINGRLGTYLFMGGQFVPSNANLFLINPNGIIFGAGASLDVGGSFVATTANAVQFPSEDLFSASAPTAPSQVLTVNPSALLYNAIAAQNVRIINRSAVSNSGNLVSTTNGFNGLQVQSGRSLLLVGGEVLLEGGILQAPGGQVDLAGLSAPGKVTLKVTGNALQLRVPVEAQRADVVLTNSPVNVSTIFAAAGGGGSISIDAHDLDIQSNSFLQTGILTGLGEPDSQAGDIVLNATGAVRISGGGIANTVQSRAVGRSGDITLTANTLELTNGAALNTSTLGKGDAGNITLSVQGATTFDGVSNGGFSSNVSSVVGEAAEGKAGNISLTTGSLTVANGAQLSTRTFGRGDAGNISLNVRDATILRGVSINGVRSNASSQVQPNAVGRSGDVSLTTGSLSVTNGAQLNSSTKGQGDAGNITLNVRDATIFSGATSLAASVVLNNATGRGGNISISTGSLTVANGATLTSSTLGRGDAGSITLIVRGSTLLDNSSGVLSNVENTGTGKGGDLSLTTGSLAVMNGSRLNSSTYGRGDAGNINITTRDAAIFNGSLVFSSVLTDAVGKGGNITLNTGSLTIANGANLFSATGSQGDAGDISFTVRNAAIFDGSGSDILTGATSSVFSGGMGKGGNFSLTADSLSLTNGAQLTSGTNGTGDAGNITLTVRHAATFDGVGSNGFLSGVGSDVGFLAVGKGGNITLNSGSLSVTNGAQLTSSTDGTGDAGNITFNIRDAATFDGVTGVGIAGVSSGASSDVGFLAVGKGGNITLNSGSLSVTNGAQLTSGTYGTGDAGDIILNVRDDTTFDGVGNNGRTSVASSRVGTTFLGNVTIFAEGKGGNLNFTTGSLSVTNGAELNSSTAGQGGAGNIVLRVRDTLRVFDGSVLTASSQTSGGTIDIAAKSIRLSGNSNIASSVFSGAGGGGNITLAAGSIIALNDSNILAFASDGKGGNITLKTRAFFGQNYRPAPPGTNPLKLIGNDRVDINASGTVSGVITLPDVSFLQNGLNQLPANPIDTTALLANSCIARHRQNGSFYITGSSSLPIRPGDAPTSPYPTGELQPIPQSAIRSESRPSKAWKIGDPIVEPQGAYQLADGQLILSRECSH